MRKKILATVFLSLVCAVAWCVILPPATLAQAQINSIRIVIAIGIGWFLCTALCVLWGGKGWKGGAAAVSLAALLTWTYASNPFDPGNDRFAGFQQDSDALVFASVEAREHGVAMDAYGLGFYYDIMGQSEPSYRTYRMQEPITNEEAGIRQGYCPELPGIVTVINDYTTLYLVPGNVLCFASGYQYRITEVQERGLGLYVTVETDTVMSEENHGELADITVQLADGTQAPVGLHLFYESQVGLQGMVASALPSVWRIGALHLLPLMCAFLFAVTVVAVAYLLGKRYDWLLAACFLTVFWLSPWVVNFAKSVYWVEFTWLLPSVVGLAASIWRGKKAELACCIGAFATILLKSLCGYEYLTFVMLGLILPLLADAVVSLSKREWNAVKRLVWLVFRIGVCAVGGFAAALMLHGWIRGNGSMVEGILKILREDGLRRTVDIDLSALSVLTDYFVFATSVINGVDGSLFPVLSVAPLLVFAYQYVRYDHVDWQDLALYGLSFLSSASWIVLAKAHCHVHTHMNYVCWYYWFIPVCFYILAKQLHRYITGRKELRNA